MITHLLVKLLECSTEALYVSLCRPPEADLSSIADEISGVEPREVTLCS